MDLSSSAVSSAERASKQEFVVKGVPMTALEIHELRFAQLVAFYQYWEPEKEDIENHARTLLEKHSLDHLIRALNTKFGVCPPSWESFGDV